MINLPMLMITNTRTAKINEKVNIDNFLKYIWPMTNLSKTNTRTSKIILELPKLLIITDLAPDKFISNKYENCLY